ncbi:hypothetical protein HSACCH_02252 [Halanaerobium saccharolyticum subsp. saccharolyticum DSM 6643]|uniref:PH (Pleckstrin Homology) domain-containing protein n=1 Tax=Halanaerobium saccharolyticum subsp. saccharolyticum DSM 6643 TaxID=1293054 RepID=M5E461_9FIRM|nr:hypothetical protein [Halanaerobium saccharolyticum]CCU80710.1 hypothetical protein HSACCH_02252 [Halanaerobium saccharolyticum subsp. saccharolyticum DSM 6643]
MRTLKDKIAEIIEADFEVHQIFKDVVKKQSIFTEDEEIEGLVFIKREHVNERVESSPVFSSAKLLVATNQGLVYAEEGFKEIRDDYFGYKMKHIYYDKISAMELDMCLLQGYFKIMTSSKEPEISVEFNTAKYYREFEKFVNKIRKKRVSYNNH